MTLTPSTAHLWVNCALSPTFIRATGRDAPVVEHADPEDTEKQREGQAADWLANTCLRENIPISTMIGAIAPNGWTVTPDMVKHIATYIDYCRSRGDAVHVQVPVNIPALSVRGRADAQVITSETPALIDGTSTTVLEVVSLKYGYRIVEPHWNAQLLCEAIALFDHTKHDLVIMTVFQPRPAHPEGKARHWHLDANEIVTAYHWLAERAYRALAPDAPGTPGGAYCRDCPGFGRCSALSEATYAAFDWIKGATMEALPPAMLAAEKVFVDEAFELIKARRTGVTTEMEGRMRRGEYMPGFGWDMQLKDREFTVDPAVIEAKTGIYPFKLVPMSPAELERAGADPAIVETITDRLPAGPKLKPHTPKAFAQMFKRAQATLTKRK